MRIRADSHFVLFVRYALSVESGNYDFGNLFSRWLIDLIDCYCLIKDPNDLLLLLDLMTPASHLSC